MNILEGWRCSFASATASSLSACQAKAPKERKSIIAPLSGRLNQALGWAWLNYRRLAVLNHAIAWLNQWHSAIGGEFVTSRSEVLTHEPTQVGGIE